MAPLIAALLVLTFLSKSQIHLSALGYQFLGDLTYSICIGIPAALVTTWISVHYTELYPRLVYALRALGLVSSAVLGDLASCVIFDVTHFSPHRAFWENFLSSIPIATAITLLIGMLAASFETLRYRLQETTLALRTQQMEQERSMKLLAEARLSSLESRVQPHFLFNTLNSIAALIPIDPQKAEDTVGKLASLLRFSLAAQQRGLVPLAQEMRIVRDYLEIEKTRFADRLRYSLEVPAALENISIPPLAVQSLVENSIKHVAAKRAEGVAMRIQANVREDRVCVEVCDNGSGFNAESISAEHGLGNLRDRLMLLFGDAGKLEVLRENEATVVRLWLPIE